MEVQKKSKPRKPYCLIIALILLASSVQAQTVENDLIGLGMPAEQAEYLAGIIPAGAVLDNNVYLQADNAAGNDTVPLIGLNATDDTVIKSDSGDPIILNPYEDAQRLFTFNASSDTAFSLTFGDGGTTAGQNLTISGGAGTDDDDTELTLAGGSSGTNTEGAYLSVTGNEASPAGRVTLSAGNVANALIRFVMEDSTSSVDIVDATTGTLWSFENDGDLSSNATTGGNLVMANTAKQVVYPAALIVTPATALTPVAAARFSQRYNALATAAPTLSVMFAQPTASVGKKFSVWNQGASPVIIIPEDGTINVTGALTPFSCATQKLCSCTGVSTTQMICLAEN